MNPELRAQVEKLDVWRLTVAARQQRGAVKQTDEEKRLAWQAYYECEVRKTKSVRGSETQEKGIHVPECFKEVAAENGIQSDPPRPSKLVSKTTALENLESTMQSAVVKESELNEKIERLKAELIDVQNDHSSLLSEREMLIARLTEAQEAMTASEQINASSDIQTTNVDRETLTSMEMSRSIEHREEIERLKVTIEQATEASEKSQKAFEDERTEKETILAKMKHAKQQFDKLRKQSHDRNIENDELKAEIERLQKGQPSSYPPTSVTPDDIQRQSTHQELQQEKANLEKRCIEAEEGLTGLRAEISGKDERISQLMARAEAVDASLQETKGQLEQIEAEKQSIAGLLEQCQHELELKVEALDAAKDVEADMESRLQTKAIEIEDLSEILDQREKEMEALQFVREEISLLRNEVADRDSRLEESSQLISELQEKLSTVLIDKETVDQEYILQSEAIGQKEAEILQLKEENVRMQEAVADQSTAVGNKDVEIVELKQETEKLQKSMTEQAEALSKRESEVLKLKQEFHVFMIQSDTLNEEIRQKDVLLEEKTTRLDRMTAEAEERETQRQDIVREKEQEIDRLTDQLQATLTSKDALESELQSCLASIDDKEATMASLRDKFRQEMLIKDQQHADLQTEVKTLMSNLKSAEETAVSFKAQLTELESVCSAAKANEHVANGKIQELDMALSETLEIAEMADQASRKAIEQKEQMLIELRSTQEQLRRLEERSRGHEEAVIKSETLQMQLSRKDVEVESLKTRYQTSNAQLEDVTSQLATIRHELMTTKDQLMESQHRSKELEAVQEQLVVAEAVKASILSDLEAKNRDIDTARDRTMDVERQLQMAVDQKTAIERRLASSQERQSHLQGRIDALENELKSARSVDNQPDLQEQLTAAQTELHQLEDVRAQQQGEIEQLRQQTASMPSLQQKIVRLETALAISGQSQQPPPVQASTEMQTVQKRAARAEAREADLMTEIQSLRSALEESRKQSLLPSTSDVSQLVGGLSNKKDEDRGYDVEAAVLSGGDPSGFQPLSGLLRGVPAMKYLNPCIRGANFVDRGFIFLMRHPALRYVLLVYFAVLHIVVFV